MRCDSSDDAIPSDDVAALFVVYCLAITLALNMRTTTMEM
jgi:hypothetical protein